METNRLYYFTVVAKTENIRKASDILNISPSALSKIIRSLEDELGVRLFAPIGRGITLTQQGKLFASKADQLLEDFKSLKDLLKDEKFKSAHSPLRITTFEVFSTYFLNVLNKMGWDHRKLILQETLPGELERAVEQDQVDVGITYLPIPFQNIEHIKITSIEMGVFKKNGTFANLPQQELPFVIPAHPLAGIPNRVRGLDGWPETAYSRKIQFEVSLMESALELCRQGRCAGYFPTFIIEEHNRKYKSEYHLHRHPSPYPGRKCYSEVYLVKRKDQIEDQTIKLIAKMIRMGLKNS